MTLQSTTVAVGGGRAGSRSIAVPVGGGRTGSQGGLIIVGHCASGGWSRAGPWGVLHSTVGLSEAL